jgi:nitrate/TMAO reductase-like tetraheme cytochrome c subunit
MKKIRKWLRQFFFPPEGTPLWLKAAPYVVLGILTLVVLVSGAYAWEYTNSPEFCGEACHTMPPEYTSYLTSPHARVDCVECHIGRGFIAERITRKAGDARHVIASVFKTYEYPIEAKQLRPARETCERCHFPEKFSTDSLKEIPHFRSDTENTPYSIYLIMKTGGGSERLGLGQGIHWHIENPVYFYAADKDQTEIPFVRVVHDNGTVTEYTDVESDFDRQDLPNEELEEMDCITCHNRITHLVNYPEDMIDKLLHRNLISPEIPEIRRVSLDLFYRDYDRVQTALDSIALLDEYYQKNHPGYYEENQAQIVQAIDQLQNAFAQSVYPEQKSDWTSHPNHIGHENTPGCFRCHGGKHLNPQEEAIRLECNLCHSIPVVSEANQFITEIEISTGPEPENHTNTNWISLHHEAFDPTCANCHTTADPGGVSDTSFCSNSACHGTAWEYAGFDAPELRATILDQLPPTPTPAPTLVPAPDEQAVSFDTVLPIMINQCGFCHNDTGPLDLNLNSYETVLAGSENGPVVNPGDPDSSPLITKTTGNEEHFNEFTTDELELIRQWIAEGAPE